MTKLKSISPIYVKTIPRILENGVLYICLKFKTTAHLCACGCGGRTVLPLGVKEWSLHHTQGKITMRPSIGNWSGKKPYHAHYYITNNVIFWL